MNKTKRKNNKRKRGRRRTIKYKGGKDNGNVTDNVTDTVTVYVWPENDPEKKGAKKMAHKIRYTQNFPDYTSRFSNSIKNGQRFIDSMFTDKYVVPDGVQVQSKSLVVHKNPVDSSKN